MQVQDEMRTCDIWTYRECTHCKWPLWKVEPFLVEFDDQLRNLDVGLLGGHLVLLVRALPST